MGEALDCAQRVVAELLGQGVREAVLCPGSRSAPLAYALEAAERAGQLRLHVRVDERTAAFLALGLTRAGGRPVVVVTTSGTAAANLHPAVLEAWHSHLPLVALTASRPRSLVHTGSNQTTDQHELFGAHAVAYAALSDTTVDGAGWRFEVTRLLVAAQGLRSRRPGPVQLDLELTDPLAPAAPLTAPPIPDPVSVAASRPAAGVELTSGPATVVVAGDLAPDPGRALARAAARAGVPLLAEPSSNARRGSAALATGRLLLTTDLGRRVERVVMFGHPTLSRPVTALLSRPGVELVVVSPYADWFDPGRSARRVVDEVQLPAALDPGWLGAWQQADRQLGQGLAALLASSSGLSGPAVARTVWAGLGEHDTLVLGASNPVRDADLAPITAEPPTVYANRGLAGIDGTISTAAGVALAVGRPTHLLVGDVTFVHDTTGLVSGQGEPRPDLRVVVANDDGGSIFVGLEHGRPELAGTFERLFATPHGVRLADLAAATGAAYVRVGRTEELAAVLAAPPLGIEVVEAVVDRAGRRALQTAVTALAATL